MFATTDEILNRPARALNAAVVASLAGVTKNYGPVCALNQVDLNVHTGEVVAVLGPNGAGKTRGSLPYFPPILCANWHWEWSELAADRPSNIGELWSDSHSSAWASPVLAFKEMRANVRIVQASMLSPVRSSRNRGELDLRIKDRNQREFVSLLKERGIQPRRKARQISSGFSRRGSLHEVRDSSLKLASRVDDEAGNNPRSGESNRPGTNSGIRVTRRHRTHDASAHGESAHLDHRPCADRARDLYARSLAHFRHPRHNPDRIRFAGQEAHQNCPAKTKPEYPKLTL